MRTRSPARRRSRSLRASTLPDGAYHAYLVGEQALPTGGRRHLVTERGADKNLVSFCGYWRTGKAADSVGRADAKSEAA